jgi:hypothetical protein
MKRLLVVGFLILSGCNPSPSADVIKALAGDPATICWTITTPWGGSLLDRNHGCGLAPASTPVVVVTPGGPTPSHVEVIRP